jgi:hypothetical protein
MAGGDKSLYDWVKGAVGGKVSREIAPGEETYTTAQAAALARAKKRVKPKRAPDGSIVGYEVVEPVRICHEPEGTVRFVKAFLFLTIYTVLVLA